MRILIVGLVKNSQFLRVRNEGEKKGHQVEGCYVSDLVIKASTEVFEVILKGGRNLKDFDLIYLWAVGKRRWDWYTTSLFLNKNFGTIIVNKKVISPEYNYYLTSSIDYLKQTESGLPYPKSAIIFTEKSLDDVIGDFNFPLIVKISEGRQGKGVFKVDRFDQLVRKVKELLEYNPSVIIREFIPNNGDVRIFTVGYKAIGAMKRIPTRKGEFRSNISQGGRGESYDLNINSEIRNLSEMASKVMETEIAGVDIMIDKNTGKPYILEINPGPQFTGLEKYTGVNAAREIIKYFESLYSEK